VNGERDEGLRHAFEALRREDATRAPGLEALLARARAPAARPPRAAAWLAVAGAAAALALLLLWRGPSVPPPPPSGPFAVGSLSVPSDVLLETPGRDLLREAPRALVPLPELPAPPRGASLGHRRLST